MLFSVSFKRFTRALYNRNFAIYSAGNSINLIGFWMQRIAVGWLTWELTRSTAWLGIMAFADLFPTVIVSPISGTIADRVNRLRLAKVIQSLAMLQAASLTLLALSGFLNIFVLLALTLCQGIIFSFWQPVRMALIPSLVPVQHLASAVALNSVIFNSARFVGPALAGFIIVISGPGWAFFANMLTSIALLIALSRLRLVQNSVQNRPNRRFISDISEGYSYALRHPGIGPALLLLAAGCICLRPVFELLPGFADEVFRRGAQGFSALASATGIGAIAGGFWIGQRETLTGLVRIMINHVLLLAGCILVFLASDNFWLGLLCIGLAGGATVIGGASGQTLLQTSVDSAMRGRVMAIYGMIFRSGPALGALIMGTLSESFGLRTPLLAGCLLALLAWWLARQRAPSIRKALEPD